MAMAATRERLTAISITSVLIRGRIWGFSPLFSYSQIAPQHAGGAEYREKKRGIFPFLQTARKTKISMNTVSSLCKGRNTWSIKAKGRMKKFKVTYEEITSYTNIYAAYLDARKGKSERNEIMRYSLELDRNLNSLYTDLQEGRYKAGGYRLIYIHIPKKRLIMALQFRDRVLQWAIYRLLNPFYEKTYIKDSYACIKGKGREKAATRLQYWLRQVDRKPEQYYYLKLDISKFFYRVDHEILLNILKRRIKDERLLDLFRIIINSEKRAFGLPLGVDPCQVDPREMLFDKGMPIGNLTSQMFANIYMNELDQYIKHELRLKYLTRYADDTIILVESKEKAQWALQKIETFLLEKLRLNLNNKTAIRPTTCNIDFVGYVINKDEIRLRSATVKRMRSRIKYITKAYENGEMTLKEVNATMQSYFGLVKHCTNEGLKESIISGFVLHCTDAARTRAQKSR